MSARAATISCGGRSMVAPPLDEFWAAIAEAIRAATRVREVRVLPAYRDGWQCFLEQLSDIPRARRLSFLRSLRIEADQPALDRLRDRVVERLQQVFGISRAKAFDVLAPLDSKLRDWTTSLRTDIAVTPEMALDALRLSHSEVVGDHNLAPPAPAFSSRHEFVEHLATGTPRRRYEDPLSLGARR